jgi:hypothetical protein
MERATRAAGFHVYSEATMNIAATGDGRSEAASLIEVACLVLGLLESTSLEPNEQTDLRIADELLKGILMSLNLRLSAAETLD